MGDNPPRQFITRTNMFTELVDLYNFNFAQGNADLWRTNMLAGGSNPTEMEWIDDSPFPYIKTTGPWWPDTNHIADGGTSPGFGGLHLIAFNYFKAVAAHGRIGNRPLWPVDLRNGWLSTTMRKRGLVMPEPYTIIPWVQAHDYREGSPAGSGITANIGLRAFPLDRVLLEDDVWYNIDIPISTATVDWVQYGSAAALTNTYGYCADIERFLARLDINMGVHMVWNSNTQGTPATGELHFAQFRIQGMVEYNPFGPNPAGV